MCFACLSRIGAAASEVRGVRLDVCAVRFSDLEAQLMKSLAESSQYICSVTSNFNVQLLEDRADAASQSPSATPTTLWYCLGRLISSGLARRQTRRLPRCRIHGGQRRLIAS